MNFQDQVPGRAVVRLVGRRWLLGPGEELTFGRDAERDIRFGHDPDDDFVSRRAGTLIGQEDGVLVRNDSRTQELILQAFPGPESRIGPQGTMGTHPYRRLRLVVPGRYGNRYQVVLDTRGLRPADTADVAELAAVTTGGSPPTRPAASVTPRELRLLTALCEPLLVLAGKEATAATYKQVAARVGQTPNSVRTCLDQVRNRLSDTDGIPGLRGDGQGIDRLDYRGPLARWAISSGTVTAAHLPLLDPDPNR